MDHEHRTERLSQARRALAMAQTRLMEIAAAEQEVALDAPVARALEEAQRAVARARHACQDLQRAWGLGDDSEA